MSRDVHVIRHLIGRDGPIQRRLELRLAEPNVEIQGFCAFVQPVQMSPQKSETAMMQSQSFPHPVSQHEAAVEDG